MQGGVAARISALTTADKIMLTRADKLQRFNATSLPIFIQQKTGIMKQTEAFELNKLPVAPACASTQKSQMGLIAWVLCPFSQKKIWWKGGSCVVLLLAQPSRLVVSKETC